MVTEDDKLATLLHPVSRGEGSGGEGSGGEGSGGEGRGGEGRGGEGRKNCYISYSHGTCRKTIITSEFFTV